MGVSLYHQTRGNRDPGPVYRSVGLQPFLLLGVYNKIVKLEGSE